MTLIAIMSRESVLKWNGWGYKDSKFQLDEKTHTFSFSGDRYKIGSQKLPLFSQWVQTTLGVDLTKKFNSQVLFAFIDSYLKD